jgi:hypothetical protein
MPRRQPAAPSSPSDLAADFIEKSGFPVEVNVIHSFESFGFQSLPSVVYDDPGTGDSGEVDVFAFREVSESGAYFRLSYIVECKRSLTVPWLLFRYQNGGVSVDPFYRSLFTPMSRGMELLMHRFAADWKDRLHLTDPLAGVASRVRDAKENQDVAYKAVSAVVRGSRIQIAATSAAHEAATRDRSSIPFEVVRPAVVFAGPLFFCDFQPDGRFGLTETQRGSVLVSGSGISSGKVLIDVVTVAGLPDYLTEQRETAEQLMTVVRTPLKKEAEFWARQYEEKDYLGVAAPAGINSRGAS